MNNTVKGIIAGVVILISGFLIYKAYMNWKYPWGVPSGDTPAQQMTPPTGGGM